MEDDKQDALLVIKSKNRITIIIDGRPHVLIDNPCYSEVGQRDGIIESFSFTGIETGRAVMYTEDGRDRVILDASVEDAIDELSDEIIESDDANFEMIDVAWFV